MMVQALAVILGIVIFGVGGVAKAAQRVFPAEQIKEISVSLMAGDLKISASGDDKIYLSSTDLEGFKVGVNDGELRIVWNQSTAAEEAQLSDADVQLRLPPGMLLELVSVSGDVEVNAAAPKQVNVRSVTGDIEVRGVKGAVTLRSISGDIETTQISGDLLMKSVAGDLKASEIESVSIEAKSVSGEVELSAVVAHEIRASTQSGDVSVAGQVRPEGSIKAKSFSGKVHLDLAKNAAFSFVGKTHSGQIKMQRNMKYSKQNVTEVRGSVGEGGPRIQAKTFSGDIVVE